MPVPAAPTLPAYDGACVTNVMAACVDPDLATAAWVPDCLPGADQVALLVLDGLGWLQLQERLHLAPTMAGLAGGPITTVAPSTTSAALTSIATGSAPSQHGVIGYRVAMGHEVLNILRWTTPNGDARQRIGPETVQTIEPFGGQRPPVVTRAEFQGSGFTRAHLTDVRFTGYRTMGTLVSEAQRLLRAGEPFVYLYYEGIDKVAHEYGLDDTYDNELRWADHLVADLLDVLPAGAALVVTADHGQVEVRDRVLELDRAIPEHVAMQSGEGRFRWLHARPGRAGALLEAAQAHGADAWVVSREQLIDEEWFGPKMPAPIAARLGDVALVARAPVSFHDPADSGPYQLIARHGSLTEAEMFVPLLAGRR